MKHIFSFSAHCPHSKIFKVPCDRHPTVFPMTQPDWPQDHSDWVAGDHFLPKSDAPKLFLLVCICIKNQLENYKATLLEPKLGHNCLGLLFLADAASIDTSPNSPELTDFHHSRWDRLETSKTAWISGRGRGNHFCCIRSSGKTTVGYWTWPLIVDLPIKNGACP